MLVVVALDNASNILHTELALDADDARRVKQAMLHSVDNVDTLRVMTLSELWRLECRLSEPFV